MEDRVRLVSGTVLADFEFDVLSLLSDHKPDDISLSALERVAHRRTCVVMWRDGPGILAQMRVGERAFEILLGCRAGISLASICQQLERHGMPVPEARRRVRQVLSRAISTRLVVAEDRRA